MAAEPLQRLEADATASIAPGPLIELTHGRLKVDVAPRAGGRIAQIFRDGIAQLVGHGEPDTAMIGWGCYPMLPWAGRVRNGRFGFGGQSFQLPLNLGAHAIHGVGFALPWQVQSHSARLLELSLALPQDERWPFGGTAYQRMELTEDGIRLCLSVQAERHAMPAVIGWHPWFRKPDRLRFSPEGIYPRDVAGIATLPVVPVHPGPWDDCFVNTKPITLERAGQRLHLSSDCTHWVVYDQTTHATCVEPQTGPPDAFNIEPRVLRAGETLRRWFRMDWPDF